jgi:hypothetical protein
MPKKHKHEKTKRKSRKNTQNFKKLINNFFKKKVEKTQEKGKKCKK